MFEKIKKERMEQLKLLYPNENVLIEIKKRNKAIKKKIAIIIAFGLICIIIYQIWSVGNRENLTKIIRGEHQENIEEVDLIAEMEGNKPYEITLEVASLEYTKEEIEVLYQEFNEILKEQILGENEDLSYVTSDLNLLEKVKDYPFQILWKSSNYKLINSSGEILFENLESNMENNRNQVTITACVRYLEFEREQYFIVNIYEKEKAPDEEFMQVIQMALLEEEENSRDKEIVFLPTVIEGRTINWVKKKENYVIDMVVTCIFLILIVFLGEREKEKRELKKREQEMNTRYPELISKLTLLLCAGYTLRKAWEQVVEDYEKRGVKIYVYEQMLHISRRIEKGLPEGIAYEEFGNLCKKDQYRKLGILLSQNLKRGNHNIVERMKEEGRQAYKTRRELAKEAGEKAQTKLLLPMMLLLMLVLLVIVIPVFVSM